MEKHKENIDRIVLKIQVLENRIQRLQEIAEQVVTELKSEYDQQISELNAKKEAAQEVLKEIVKLESY